MAMIPVTDQRNVKKFDFLALYLEADNLLNNMKQVCLDYKEGSIMATQKIAQLEEEIKKMKGENVPKPNRAQRRAKKK